MPTYMASDAAFTEVARGISLAKLLEGDDWGLRESFAFSAIFIATWDVFWYHGQTLL